MKIFTSEKHSSLFCQSIGDEQKQFCNIDTNTKLFSLSQINWQNKLECFSVSNIWKFNPKVKTSTFKSVLPCHKFWTRQKIFTIEKHSSLLSVAIEKSFITLTPVQKLK